MYLANFELGERSFHCGAALASGPDLPSAWSEVLNNVAGVDFALRIRPHGHSPQVCVIASGPDASQLSDLFTRLDGNAPGAGICRSAEDFDAAVMDLPKQRLWLSHRGYQVERETVVTDFRLYAQLAQFADGTLGSPDDFAYQINLRHFHPSKEDRRQVRKYIAAQRLESPFPARMRDLQIALAGRLLEGAALIEEFVATSLQDAVRAKQSLATRFDAEMGEFGFDAPPMEESGFDELLLTGRHSTRFEADTHFMVRAACCLRRGETEQLLRTGLEVGPGTVRTGAPASAESVFISYSSNDYPVAAHVCESIERHGLRCWIAPRNINPGEPYPEAIMRGIQSSQAMVCVLSESSNLSPHVHREIERALQRNAVIVPLRIQDIRPTGSMEYLLSTLQWVEAHEAGLTDGIQQVVRRLQFLIDDAR